MTDSEKIKDEYYEKPKMAVINNFLFFFPIYEHVVLVFHSVAKDFMHQFLHMCLKIKTWYQFKSVWFPMLNETF